MTSPTSLALSPRCYYSWLLAIVVIGVVFRYYHFHLAIGNDDQRWIIAAQELGSADVSRVPAIYHSRILWSYLLAGWGKATGGIDLQRSAVLMFALSCLTTLLVASGAQIAFGPFASLLAAAVYATHPINIAYDVVTLPDGFAVAMLAGCLVLFLKYLHGSRTVYLMACGALVGLSYSAKEYYILAALPFGMSLFLQGIDWKARLRNLSLFSTCVAVGLSGDLLLHLWNSGNPLAHFQGLATYGERLLARSPPAHTGLQLVARLAAERLNYFQHLFCDAGIVSGFVVLWGMLFLVLNSRRRLDCWMLLSTVLLLFGFLLAMPASVVPFSFVEMQSRYLTLLLPAVAIGCGGALAGAFKFLKDSALRSSLLVSLVVGFSSNVFMPDYLSPTYQRSSVLQFDGIRQVLKDASNHNIEELWLPAAYSQTIPDCYHSYGVALRFFDLVDERSAEAAAVALEADHMRAFFVPRTGLNWPLIHLLSRGEYEPGCEVDSSYKLMLARLEAEGCVAQTVRVPDTPHMEWLAALGLVSREQRLVGWIHQFGQHVKSDMR